MIHGVVHQIKFCSKGGAKLLDKESLGGKKDKVQITPLIPWFLCGRELHCVKKFAVKRNGAKNV